MPCGKILEDDPSIWVPGMHVGDPGKVLGLDLVVVVIWGVNQ